MRYFGASKAQLRLWALLTMAFVIVGVSAGLAVLKLSLDRYTQDYRSELTNLVSLATMSVDPEAHAKLKTIGQMDSESYRSQVAKLAEVQGHLNNVRYVYTIHKSDQGYEFILDPTPPGDHDNDGQDDKSYLGDPYPEISMAAKSCYENGVVTVELDPTVDRWGTFISAFAPIKDKSGKVVAILGIDRLANDIVTHQRDLKNAVIAGLLLVLFLGAFFGWAFTRKMAASTENRGWLRYLTGSTRIFRATILEVVMVSLAFVVFLGGVQSLSSQNLAASELRHSLQETQKLNRLKFAVDMEIHNRTSNRSELAELARETNTAWLFQDLINSTAKDFEETLVRSRDHLDTDLAVQRRALAEAQRSIEEHQTNLQVIFFVSAFLALGTFVIIRTANIQQQDLIAAQTDSEWHQVAYRQVVENLPVGLFIYRGGEITFSNAAWDAQCGRQDREDRMASLLRSMSEVDSKDLLIDLKRAEDKLEPFSTQFKITTQDKQKTILDTRGVPMKNTDGEFECLLGFTLDVTQRASAQDLLKGKNREVQSKNRMLSRAITDLEENFEAMVQALVKAVEAKDIYTAGHSERVMRYSMRIGEELKLSASDMRVLEMGTLVHDIGKIGIPDAILLKPSKLTDEEYHIIQQHAPNGAMLVEGIPIFHDCLPIIRWHHERLDGTGYPDGIQGKEIPLLVRIAAVADVFDAMTSNRAYREGRTMHEAVAVLTSMAESGELDPEIVAILAEIVGKEDAYWFETFNQAA